MKLNKIFSQKGLISKKPQIKDIKKRIRLLSPNKKFKIFYGETYDFSGDPVDSMKYYFFVANLAKGLKMQDVDVEPMILIADTAACRNVGTNLYYRYMQLGKYRAGFVKQVNEIYKTNLKVIKMSEFIHSSEFQTELEKVISICRNDQKLMEMIERSVPESKVEIERKKGFMYSFDEITTILDLDIKVGPPREDLYDKISREVALRMGKKQLMSLFLSPTYPLGMSWHYFFIHKEIEKYGITAYKGASKRLQANRILVGKTNSKYAEELINKSFISTDPFVPNPVLDLAIIVEMARQRLEEELEPITLYKRFYGGEISPKELKKKVAEDLNTYILSRF